MAVRKVIARSSGELAAVLGLSSAEHAALRIQFELVEEIGRELKRVGLTHAALARLAQKVRVADEVGVADAMNFTATKGDIRLARRQLRRHRHAMKW